MIDPKNRLCKLVKECMSYPEFYRQAVYKSSWYLGPYSQAGQRIDKPWLENFWKSHKGA
jgi:hypothetical protein